MIDEQINLRKRLQDIRITRTETKPVNLRIFDHNNVKGETKKLVEILKHFLKKEIRHLIRSASIFVGELAGKKERKVGGSGELKLIF